MWLFISGGVPAKCLVFLVQGVVGFVRACSSNEQQQPAAALMVQIKKEDTERKTVDGC